MADKSSGPAGCIDVQEFNHAEELISALRPESPLWKPEPGGWIFRGHADSSWKLLPSANRRKSLGRFLGSTDLLKGEDNYCEPQVNDVWQLLKDFADTLNAAGLPIPGQDGVRDLLKGYSLVMFNPFSRHFERLTALGQHHGLPTMLLDWTRVGTYAAYFAASDVADLESKNADGRLEVWALNKDVGTNGGLIGAEESVVRVVEPPGAGNANLHFQGGVFTLTVPAGFEVSDGDSVIPLARVDQAVCAAAEERRVPGTLMRRLSLPWSEAQKVLRLLAYENVAGTALFPGLDGVVRSVRDDRHRR